MYDFVQAQILGGCYIPEVRKAEKTRTRVITVPGAHKAGVAIAEAGMIDRKGPGAAGKMTRSL